LPRLFKKVQMQGAVNHPYGWAPEAGVPTRGGSRRTPGPPQRAPTRAAYPAGGWVTAGYPPKGWVGLLQQPTREHSTAGRASEARLAASPAGLPFAGSPRRMTRTRRRPLTRSGPGRLAAKVRRPLNRRRPTIIHPPLSRSLSHTCGPLRLTMMKGCAEAHATLAWVAYIF